MKSRKIVIVIALVAVVFSIAGCVKVEKECTFNHWRWPQKEGGEARAPRMISTQYLTIADLASQYDDLIHGDTVRIYAFVCVDTADENNVLFLSDSKEYKYEYAVPDYFLSNKHLPMMMVRYGQNDSWNSRVCLRDLPDSVAHHADTARCYVEGCIDFADMGGCVEKMQLYISPDQIITSL